MDSPAVPFPADEPVFEHVHLALMPDLNSLHALVNLQAQSFRGMPPESARLAAWVPPEFWGIVLAYLGQVQASVMPAVQDVMKSFAWPQTVFQLQAVRFSTAHDAQGNPRLLAVGFDAAVLQDVRAQLAKKLENLGFSVLPGEFLPRIVLARLPENMGPVMAAVEAANSIFPVTLRFAQVDLAARSGRQRTLLARVLPGKDSGTGLFSGMHGCCREQSNRFALHGGSDCPLRNTESFQLDCFETGCTPKRPPDTPADAKVETDMVHEGMQDLLRAGRGRFGVHTEPDKELDSRELPPVEEEKAPAQSPKPAAAPSVPKPDRPAPSVNHRNPRQEKGKDFKKKPGRDAESSRGGKPNSQRPPRERNPKPQPPKPSGGEG